MQILIPIAGEGLRFKNSNFNKPKPLIDIFGKQMILRVIECFDIEANFFFILRKNSYYEELKNLLLNKVSINKIITTDHLTKGPACSAMLAENYIKHDEELIITNCDQYIKWNIEQFIARTKIYPNDGIIVTYNTDVQQNSYAKIKNGIVTEIKEKEVISKYSLNGVHYWRKASFFFNSAREMISNEDTAINGEYYIGPTYNYLINKGYKIGHFHLKDNIHYSLGNDYDLRYFLKNEKI